MKKVIILVGALLLFALTLFITNGGTKTGKQVWNETFNTPDTVIIKIQ